MANVEKQDRGKMRVDVDECKGCGLCVEACPPKVIKLGDKLNHYGYRTATGQNRAAYNRFISLHQLLAHSLAPTMPLPTPGTLSTDCFTILKTVIAPGSGQTIKQIPQAVQPTPSYVAVR